MMRRLQIHSSKSSGELLHQQHLPRTFHRAVQLPLVVRREAGVFPREDAPLVSDKLAEEGGILKIERIDSEIDLRLGPRRARFHRAPAAAFLFLWMCFAWHNLLDLPVQSVAAQERV